ncbi:hypothetical protein B1812_05120 [Methylocystis bryophila]|uniref:Uncharacterized protein n=1 Tax=Methylocystis bryophila TaxID=655015 RepID=A0A1W6MSK8_9HYPH|nr:hypothetical protein B1812_05120 [Methylocystis bryophila]
MAMLNEERRADRRPASGIIGLRVSVALRRYGLDHAACRRNRLNADNVITIYAKSWLPLFRIAL